MTWKRKTRTRDLVSSSRESFQVDWNWLFLQCPTIFAVLVSAGFLLILFWVLF